MSANSPRADELLELLCGLELEPRQLRADPEGQAWLPDLAREWIEAEPQLIEVVREFSETECMLFDEAREAPDAFFSARVMEKLPEDTPIRVDLRRRILGLSYVVAAAVAGAALTPSTWFEAEDWLSGPWHEWLDAVSVGGVAFVVALIVSAVAVLWAGDGEEPLQA
jgi:hypothetical protein